MTTSHDGGVFPPRGKLKQATWPGDGEMTPSQLLETLNRDEYSLLVPANLLREYVEQIAKAEEGIEEEDWSAYQNLLAYLSWLAPQWGTKFEAIIRADAKFEPSGPAYTRQEQRWLKGSRPNRGIARG